MIELLAPNGKPSNLTPEQYKLVRTPAFKEWFGDWENSPENASKVVDENGEPKVKWRGDNNPKNVFDYINYGGHGVYYFGDVGFAESFGDKLRTYFINCRNPFLPNKTTKKQEKEIRNLLEKDANKILTEIIENGGFDNLYDFLDNYYLIEAGFDENSKPLDILVYQLKNGLNYFILELRPIIEWLKNNNYNGYESYEGNYDNIAVFNSNQIKLADGTNKTFDGSNPDIRFEGGGLTYSEVETRVDNFLQWFENNGWKELSQEEVIKAGLGNVDDYFWIEGYTFQSPDKNVLLQFSRQARYILDKYGVFQKIYSRYRDKEPIIMLDTLLVKEKGKGQGTKAIKLITELADKFGVIIHLYSKPIPKMEYLNDKKLFDFYKKAGFEVLKENETQKIMVYNPNQIKLTDGTNTTFDSNNPDIRFMAGGDTKKIKNEEYIVFREEYFKHLIAGELGNIKSFSEKNGNKNINDLAIKLSLLHQQQKAYLQGGDIINELYLLAKKIDENTGLKTSKDITYNSIIKRDIFFLKETHDKIDEEAIPIFNEKNPDIRFDDGGFVMDEEKGEKFIKKLSELGCNKPLTNFQMNFFGFLDSLKDDCVSLGGFWYDSNTTNYAYSQMGKMVLFDIEDFYNEKERSAFIEKNYPTSTPLEIQPFDDDNYEFIGIGEASMGGVFRDIRDGSILKLTASPFEVVGTTKILNAQKKDIHYEDNFAEIYSIQNIGKGVFKGTWYYKYYNEREFNGNWFAIRREDITPFNEQEQKEANCVKEIIVNYYSMFDNRNYQPEIFGSYDIYEPNREFQYLLRKQNNYGEGGDINWNLDRYRQVEKEMYDLRTQGKGDTLEYFKLIKERSILEQAKMNPSYDSKNSFAKGGNIIAYKKDFQKFNKIGITDKYIIEAITEIGLQDTKFDKESIEKTIEKEFKNLINSYQEYIISEDSNEISRQILFDKNARFLAGEEDENLKDFDNLINSKERRKEEYIEKYADTQIETINEWISYLTKSEYPVAIKFLLLKSVLNFNYNYKIDDLIKRTDTTIRNFTLFDAGSLSELIASNSDYLLKDYTKIQLENAEKIIKSKEFVKTSGDGTWLKFNGGSNSTQEEISKNSIELSQLVQNTYWCTKTNSKSQLYYGDFYVYVTKNNGEIFPRIAIRMQEDLVGEVRGNKSSAQDIEEEMLPIAEEFLQKSISNNSGKIWLDSINYNKEALNFNTKLTEDGIFENSVQEFIKLKSKEKKNLLDYADRNGHIVRIENLLYKLIKSPNKFYAKNEVVIKLSDFDNKKTKIIIGNADFTNTQITDLGQLNTIEGTAYFRNSQVTNLGNLTTIKGNAYFQDSQIKNLGNLTTIGGDAVFRMSKITDLGQLTTIGGFANFENSKIKNLGQLTTIEGTAYFENSQITNLGQLTTIGGSADFGKSKITDLGNLTTIGNFVTFKNTKIKNLGQLTTIGGFANFTNSQITDLGQLTTIGGIANFTNSQITNLGQLNTIGGTADFGDSEIENLGKLTTIGGNAYFGDSQVTDLGNLTTIGGTADFGDSEIENLGKLTTIGGFTDFENSKIKNLGQLTTIEGTADFTYSQVTDLGQLTTIGGDADFIDSQVKDLGQLTTIGDNAYFTNSQITDLGQLTTIKSGAYFRMSKITDLGQLTTIGGFADFGDSEIENLGKLTTIGGTANFTNSQVTDLGQLTTIGGDADFGDRIDLKKEWEEIKNTNKNKTKNMNSQTTENFAKGGKILIKEITENGNIKIVHQDFQKFLRIGITDKYFIEASNDVGLQGVNFDEASLLKKISIEFNNMLDEYEDYIINEDSEFITNIMKNKIKTEKRRGASLEVLRELELEIDNDNARKREIREIAGTQKESLEQWILYLKQSDYNVIFKYLILKAVLKFNYTLNTDKLSERDNITIRNFTPFDAGSLAELYYGSSNFLLKDYVLLMNENSKKVFKTQEVIKTTSEGKWIKFNGGNKTTSKEKDENGVQLMRLVQNTYWCTKSAGRSQLDGGDFYVYVTEKDGEILPRIAVRMNENLVGEIRGNFSSAQDIEPDMLPISESFLVENIPNDSGKKWLDAIRYNTKCAEMTERFNTEGMYQDFIFDYIKLIAEKSKYKVDYGENGNVVNLENKFKEVIKISNEFYKSGDIEIDSDLITKKTIYLIGDLTKYELDKLINKQVKINELKNWKLKFISGNLECSDIITDLGNIEIIGKSLRLSPKFENLNKLKFIGAELEFNGSNVESLKNLESIGSGLMLNGKIKDLGKLKKIGFLNINTIDDSFSLGNLEEIVGDLNIFNDTIDFDFGDLKTIGGSLNASNSKITDLKNLESVGNDFIISGSKIKNFQNLKTIGGDADFSNNFCSSTQNIESILGSIKLLNSRIMDFPKLLKIGGELYFKGSFFKSLGSIKYIGGNLNFAESKVEDLGDLESIGGYASFKSSSSNIKSLKKLKNIVKFANFTDSMVEDLGDLESIGGNVYFKDSKVKSLGKLNFVGGLVMMKKNNYNGLEGFRDIILQELKN